MARKRAEEAGGGVLRVVAVAASGTVHLVDGTHRHLLTPEAAKRLAVELEASATAVWSAQRLRRQDAERSACCGD